MTEPPRPRQGGAFRRSSLRLVPVADAGPCAAQSHPLTTPAAPLLPSRAPGAAHVWEELDRAADHVLAEALAGRLRLPGSAGVSAEPMRHTLRLLCVAARTAWASAGRSDGPAPLRHDDVPAGVPAGALARAMRQRLAVQTLEARERGAPAADSAEVLRVLVALDAVESALDGDGVQTIVAQLGGATALDLLVEVAHDMRSPLGSILFLVERLRGEASLGEAAGRSLALVHSAAFGLSAMVGDVMELARRDRPAAGVPGPIIVAEILEAVRAIVAPLAEEKGLLLRVDAPPRDVRLGHGPALHRVLVNLATNALKFTAAGEVVVSVESCAGDRLAFVVRDTGRGIPPTVMAQLFQAFRTRTTGAPPAFSSAGLGLAICQRLLRTMGGVLDVQSTEGGGTTFRFELELPPAAERTNN